jgi:predicted AAA+ superfamily ATPase
MNMLGILREMITDFHETPHLCGIPRRIQAEAVTGKASVFIGVRRAGKSTWMHQKMGELESKGISRENFLYINFFDDRLHDLRTFGLGSVTEAYFSLYPEKKNRETIYCFFDEIQEISGWEPFVERILRTETCEVYITGSSAKMLSKEVATQMRGRALTWEIFPFSFREFLDFKGIESAEPFSARQRLIIQKAFEEYRETGGFPETSGMNRNLRIKTHQEYFNTLLFRDLIERYDISHPKALTDLVRRLIDNIASLYSVNSLTGYLKSLGHHAPKPAVSEYLDWLEDAFFLFTVRIFDASLARTNTNPKKIYCIDHALVNSVSSGILINSGHLLENMVFITLRRQSPDIRYYKTGGGREVDFIVQRHRVRQLIQVCESIADPQTRKREVDALEEAMKELLLSSAVLVTLNETDRLTVHSGEIDVVPAWKFFLMTDGVSV